MRDYQIKDALCDQRRFLLVAQLIGDAVTKLHAAGVQQSGAALMTNRQDHHWDGDDDRDENCRKYQVHGSGASGRLGSMDK